MASAAALIGSRGVEATSFSDVLAASRAPRGSIYHHFPGGKKELVREAMSWTTEQILAYQRACTARTPAGVIDHFVDLFRSSMVTSGCRAGCPIAGVLVDTYSGDDDLLGNGRSSFRAWAALLSSQLAATGVARPIARSLAVTSLASAEGALILCRAEQSVRPLNVVATQLRQMASAVRREPTRR